MSDEINLGDEVKCKVTGYQGVVTSIAKCLTGCDRATVQPPVNKEGKFPDGMWFDLAALKLIKKGKVKPESVQERPTKEKPHAKPGGPPTRAVRR